MISVVCVLKSGGIYNTTYVKALARGIKVNSTLPYKFWCMTDTPFKFPGVNILSLRLNLPGWWSKVEVWNPSLAGILGRALYIDLDTLVTGNIDNILGYDGDLCLQRDFAFLDCPSIPIVNFAPKAMKPVWDVFHKDPERWMREGDKCIAPHFGDQILVSKALKVPLECDYWQDILAGEIVSYRFECRNHLPPEARLVSCHGLPKPHEIKEPWFRQLWLKYSKE